MNMNACDCFLSGAMGAGSTRALDMPNNSAAMYKPGAAPSWGYQTQRKTFSTENSFSLEDIILIVMTRYLSSMLS